MASSITTSTPFLHLLLTPKLLSPSPKLSLLLAPQHCSRLPALSLLHDPGHQTCVQRVGPDGNPATLCFSPWNITGYLLRGTTMKGNEHLIERIWAWLAGFLDCSFCRISEDCLILSMLLICIAHGLFKEDPLLRHNQGLRFSFLAFCLWIYAWCVLMILYTCVCVYELYDFNWGHVNKCLIIPGKVTTV